MGDKTNFIKNVYTLIKNETDMFKDIDLQLKIINCDDLPEYHSAGEIKIMILYNSIQFVMVMINDFDQWKNKRPEDYEALLDSNRDFFKSLDIDVTEESLIVATVIHEFGHVAHILKFKQDHHPMDYQRMVDINSDLLKMAYINRKHNRNVNHNIAADIYYDFMFHELYAENYKFKHFMRIWKLLGINNK